MAKLGIRLSLRIAGRKEERKKKTRKEEGKKGGREDPIELKMSSVGWRDASTVRSTCYSSSAAPA